ncbi:MAG: 1-acyl-sn-glycerol-3-phosphate acyltransferase [Pseudomonadales bacterium]
MKKLNDRLDYYWRVLATGLCFSLFGIGGVVIPVAALPVIWLLGGGRQARQKRARFMAHKVFVVFVFTMKSLRLLTWQVAGREQLLQPGQLVLANHPTLIDVVFLVSLIPNACCIVKKSLRFNPAMRGFLAITGYITNDNAEQLLGDAKQALANGSSVIAFPEGTRATPGEPLHFQRGPANIAVRTRSAITPVTISCKPISLTKGNPWYNVPPSQMRFQFTVGSKMGIDAYLHQVPTLAARQLTRDLQTYFTKELGTNDDRQES